MRVVRCVLALAALSSLVAVAAPTAGAQTPTVTSVIGSADGLFVEIAVNVNDSPGLTFGPEPTVTLPSEGGAVSEEVAGVDETVAGAVGLTAALVRTSAEGELGPSGFATAESTVADIALLEQDSQQVGGILEADAVTATCAADLDGVSGSTTLVNATVLGEALPAEPGPNTPIAIEINGSVVEGTLNRQVENPDGSLSVTALVLDIQIGDLLSGTLEIGPATCGVVEGVEVPAEVIVPAQPVAVTPTFTG